VLCEPESFSRKQRSIEHIIQGDSVKGEPQE
jgi:hypothetical protein